MLPIKLERFIFIVIFIICSLMWTYFVTHIKVNELPINAELTPEQVIETEIKDKEYKYIKYSNIMFVCVKEQGFCDLIFAFRGDKSGFMFDIPGYSFGLQVHTVGTYICMASDQPPMLHVYKAKSKYYAVITDAFEKMDIEFFKNGEKIDVLTFDNTQNQYWVCEIDDLSSVDQIEGYYQGKRIQIIDFYE